jgi:hypothetical protein
MGHKLPVLQLNEWSTRLHFKHLWELVGLHRIPGAIEPVNVEYVPQAESVSEQASPDHLSFKFRTFERSFEALISATWELAKAASIADLARSKNYGRMRPEGNLETSPGAPKNWRHWVPWPSWHRGHGVIE